MGDIRSLEDMRGLVGQVVKTSTDGGQSWDYRLITGGPEEWRDGEFGYPVDKEGKEGSTAITDLDLAERDLMVRTTTSREVKGKVFFLDHRPAPTTRRYSLGGLVRRSTPRPEVPQEVFDGWQAVLNGDGLPTEVSAESAAAAKWWTEKLHDSSRITAEQRESFQTDLARRIEGMDPDWQGEKQIGVRHDADRVLDRSARVAGIRVVSAELPMFTQMTVAPGKVAVSVGERAPKVTVFPPQRGAQGPGSGKAL